MTIRLSSKKRLNRASPKRRIFAGGLDSDFPAASAGHGRGDWTGRTTNHALYENRTPQVKVAIESDLLQKRKRSIEKPKTFASKSVLKPFSWLRTEIIHTSRSPKPLGGPAGGRRRRAVLLSACSPELNPDERLNADLKHRIPTAAPARTRKKLLEEPLPSHEKYRIIRRPVDDLFRRPKRQVCRLLQYLIAGAISCSSRFSQISFRSRFSCSTEKGNALFPVLRPRRFGFRAIFHLP